MPRPVDPNQLHLSVTVTSSDKDIQAYGAMRSIHVLERLGDLFVERGTPAYIRSDNGPEFTAKQVRSWLERLDLGTLLI